MTKPIMITKCTMKKQASSKMQCSRFLSLVDKTAWEGQREAFVLYIISPVLFSQIQTSSWLGEVHGSGSCPAPVHPKAKLHIKGWIARLRMFPSALGFIGDIRNWYKEEDRAMPFSGSIRQIQQYLLKMI